MFFPLNASAVFLPVACVVVFLYTHLYLWVIRKWSYICRFCSPETKSKRRRVQMFSSDSDSEQEEKTLPKVKKNKKSGKKGRSETNV